MVAGKNPKFILVVVIALLSLVLAVGCSVVLSLSVSTQTKQQICNGFAYFIHKPTSPKSTVIGRREALQYRNLQIFESKVGCHD